MTYTLLIYESPATLANRTTPDGRKYISAWQAYTAALQAAGVLIGGSGLELPEHAATLRLVNGQRQVQDGPFSTSKEQLAGFFVIAADNVDAALAWAGKAPAAPDTVMEVRPNLPAPVRDA